LENIGTLLETDILNLEKGEVKMEREGPGTRQRHKTKMADHGTGHCWNKNKVLDKSQS
jgi:hypothetical protein